jgi:hypothetical protein
MDINDGGPAFPKQSADGEWYEGMSLRDWFAGQALVGLLASGHPSYNLADTDQNAQYAAFRAYVMAEEMLAARAIEEARANA